MVSKIIQIYRFTKILKNFIIHLILLYIYLFEISSTRRILLSIALVNTILRNFSSSWENNQKQIFDKRNTIISIQLPKEFHFPAYRVTI